MKVKIEEWHAVSTWTWNAEDDSCGICRCAT
jgi:anaphase-promoting complex subunit 11